MNLQNNNKIPSTKKIKHTNKSETYITDRLYIIYTGVILLVLGITYINYILYKKYGKSEADLFIQFPFKFLASLFVFFAIGKIGYDTLKASETTEEEIQQGLSHFTQEIVVDRWEADAMNYPVLNTLYKEIFSMGTGNSFYTRAEWNAKGLSHIKYVPYDGNEEKWHYSAKFIQEMVNIVRMFKLEDKFKINNKLDLIKSNQNAFAGWITCFRMYLNNPIVRNVWEQYKYRHVNPKFTAWVHYFVIDVVEKNPDFFLQHRNKWDSELKQWLK
uniref:Uncharacterized protein n=1 Tax=viral metagenome TaxID=1070528 RepID=A0A6C0LXH1_9ZZZZ